jgi:hypothetical protein
MKHSKLIITILLVIISLELVAQPCTNTEEYLRKRHQINGMTNGHPYTIFDRHNGKSVMQTLNSIRENIMKDILIEGALSEGYLKIYQNATSTMPTDDGLRTIGRTTTSYSQKAVWAKNNAFVFLVGLDASGRRLDSLDPTYSSRNAFRDRALKAFDSLTGIVIPHEPLTIYVSNTDDGNMQHYSRSLILWLQTYDLLKGAYEEDSLRIKNRNPYGFGDADRNGPKCSPRQKLRQLTRDFYTRCKDLDGIVEHWTGWKKNHGIACASALLMAAQVLNDAGVETSLIGGFFKWIFGEPWPMPKYSPIKWNELGQKGLDENLFEGWHMIGFRNVPVAPRNTIQNDYSPYTEGPAYALYGLVDCGIPAMRAQQNLYPNWSNEPFFKRNEIINIFNWLNEITVNNSMLPTYDNSSPNNHCSQLALINEKFYYGDIDRLDQHLADFVAYIGGNNISVNSVPKSDETVLPETGNIILRGETETSKYYFHMLAEKGSAIDKAASTIDGTHEDDDLGSFMIYAWDKSQKNPNYLAIDPPYLGWNKENKAMETNRYWLHNTIEINDGQDALTRDYHGPNITKHPSLKIGSDVSNKSFDLSYGYLNTEYTANFHYDVIKRNVNEIKAGNNFYYFMNDYIDATPIALNVSLVQLNLNGNGDINQFESKNSSKPKTFRKEGNLYLWTHPCGLLDSNSNYRLTYHISALNNNISGKEFNEHFHSSPAYNSGGSLHESGNQTICYDNSDGRGQHTRLQIKQPVKKTIFQSFLYPQKCNEPLPTVTKVETSDFVATRIRIINGYDTSITRSFYSNAPDPNKSINDTSSHFHYARFNGMEQDSVQNPFNLPNQSDKWVQLDAQKAFLRNQTMAMAHGGFKYCPPSYLNLRYASITNGSYVKFNDTFLIHSSIPVNAALGFSGRYSYLGNIKPITNPSDLDSIRFYLADVGKGVDMIALDFLTRNELGCRYDSFSNTIAIKIPTKFTNIIIEQRDKCNDCYFPPSWKGIDTLFTIDDGLIHTLGHKLSVKPDFGNLHLSNGSRLDMCPEVYLRNRDTIIIEGPAQTKEMILPNCYGIDSLKAVSSTSAIIVKSGSALVLDSGSFTYVKNGGAIYVKQNGSLVIKNGAFVQIGDSGSLGWGEIITEQGAFIHIEPLAHIEYKSTIGDTIDRNLFVLGGGNNNAAFAGVYYLIDTILKLDTVLPIHYTSVDICALDTINPVKNKYWGYTNFAMPLATFSSRNDTLCPREPLHIKLNRILNDAQVQIKVCRMDSILVVDDGSGFTQWKDTCIADSIPINLIQPDPVCTPPRIMPDEWTYYFKPNTLNRVTISVINDCGKIHDTVAYIFATDTPKISIHVPDSACEGFGGFAVTASNRTQLPVKYAYEVSEYFNDTQSLLIGTLNPSEVYSFSDVGIVPDSFIFNNYYFKGGRSYIISLSVQNECNSFDIYDTIHIRSGAAILLSKPNVYAEPINGPKSVKLTAIIKQVDSLNWHPALWLNRTDTAIVISTPNDSIGYILTAYTGACLSRDTAIIKYNRVANAGLNDTLCFTNDTALLGNSYDMSIFLGWLYYLGGNEFRDMFMHYTSNQIDYFRYFTHFMMHEEKLQQWASFCPAEIVKTYNNQINRRVIFNLPWFKNYYASFTAFNDANIDAFDYFKTQIETDAGLMANLSGYVNWPVVQDCVNEMFYFYDDFLNNHLQEISSTWIKVSQNDTTVLTAWDEYFVAIDNPQQTSIYIQTVITPQYAEIDEVTVYRDTVLVPYFYAAMQFDSTVYFANATLPFSEATTFTWNFGDGSPISNLDYPIHTFAAFDTSYVVCMTANNKCGSFMYCDTIRIDSSSLSNQRVVYNNSRPGFSKQADIALNSDKQVVNVLNRPEIFLTNYPNPFGDKTIIDYQIWQPFSNAALVITNTFGQVVHEQKLYKPIDKVSINGNDFASGLYYYSIVVDNATKVTKMMSVMH